MAMLLLPCALVGYLAGSRLHARLPQARVRDLYWGFHFMLGALVMTFAETGRVDLLSGVRCQSSRLDLIYRRLIPFLAAGFERIAQVGGTQPLPRVTTVRKKNK